MRVRGAAEWEAGHLPGVENVPLGYLSDRLYELARDRPLVVHCQGGARSAIAASLLRARGFDAVIDLEGGYAAWLSATLPRSPHQLYSTTVIEATEDAMGRFLLTPELLELVAERFKALAEPARLRILNVLRDGERTVSELMEETSLGQANVSKHLQMLHALGFVARRKEGLYVYYSLAGEEVFQLCDIVCGRLAVEADTRGRMLHGA